MDLKTVGNRIAHAREHVAGFKSRSEFARQKLDIDPNQLWFYEHDKRVPSGDRLLAIADACGVEVRWLITGDGPMRPPDNGNAAA